MTNPLIDSPGFKIRAEIQNDHLFITVSNALNTPIWKYVLPMAFLRANADLAPDEAPLINPGRINNE